MFHCHCHHQKEKREHWNQSVPPPPFSPFFWLFFTSKNGISDNLGWHLHLDLEPQLHFSALSLAPPLSFLPMVTNFMWLQLQENQWIWAMKLHRAVQRMPRSNAGIDHGLSDEDRNLVGPKISCGLASSTSHYSSGLHCNARNRFGIKDKWTMSCSICKERFVMISSQRFQKNK